MPLSFILASASPARRRLLLGAGIDPVVRPSDFDESQVQCTDPKTLVKTLALRKAEAIAHDLQRQGIHQTTLVLGCDSVLELQGEIHGKPANPAEAIARWQQMRGQVGQLHTGHALFKLTPGPLPSAAALHPSPTLQTLLYNQVTHVHFAQVSDPQIANYVATGEPLACAGCFALEGKGSAFVEKIEGCHTNVIGLSLPLLRRMLAELGHDITDFWSPAT
jgi:septum formation protein